jgi:hypothetical protein
VHGEEGGGGGSSSSSGSGTHHANPVFKVDVPPEIKHLVPVFLAVRNDKFRPLAFLTPVSPAEFPTYASVVKHPMWLDEVERKLTHGLYRAPGEFHADMARIFENAKLFNPDPRHQVHEDAVYYEAILRKKWDAYKEAAKAREEKERARAAEEAAKARAAAEAKAKAERAAAAAKARARSGGARRRRGTPKSAQRAARVAPAAAAAAAARTRT